MSVKRWWGSGGHKMAGAYRDCFNLDSPQGQAVLDDLARLCMAGETTLVYAPGHSVDPLLLAFNEGKRSVFLHLCDALGVNVAAYMVEKYKEEQASE